MANLTITAGDVAIVESIEQFTAPAHEALTAGAAVYFVAASGKVGLADEDVAAPVNEPEGLTIRTAIAQNDTVTVVKKGIVDLGDALDGMDYGATVYLSATAGKIADADPANTVVIGEVVPVWGHTTADKALRLDL